MDKVVLIQNTLKQHINISKQNNPMFFKIGPGEYAEHDKFLGVPVPVVQTIAKKFAQLSLEEINYLLSSPYNEERLLALFILLRQYQKADPQQQKALYEYYVKNLHYINNWNLVDRSASDIMGSYLFEYNINKDILLHYAQSNNLWERRIAIIATFYFIKKLDFTWTFKIAKLLLNDTHDLIYKAVGWMLREVGKKDIQQLTTFLDEYATRMPRTMLRYAIEKFSPEKRSLYMNK